MSQSNYITLALFALIGLVFLIDFINSKSKKSIDESVDEFVNKKSVNPEYFKIFNIVFFSIYFVFVGLYFFGPEKVKETNFKDFNYNILQQQKVDRLTIVNKQKVFVYIKTTNLNDDQFKDVYKNPFSNSINLGPHYYFEIGSVDSLLTMVTAFLNKNTRENLSNSISSLDESLTLSYETRNKNVFVMTIFFFIILPFLLIYFPVFLFFKRNIFKYVALTFILIPTIIHVQHEYVRYQFKKNLEPVSNILQNEQHTSSQQDDYCLLILNKCKDDLNNKSLANILADFNNMNYVSMDLIDFANNLIDIVDKNNNTTYQPRTRLKRIN